MSKQREKKIKRLRKISLVPQIIEAAIVEAAFIVAVLFVIIIEFLAEPQKLVSINATTVNTVLQTVESGWNKKEKTIKPQADDFLKNTIKYNSETIGAIYILDDNKNILAQYGSNDFDVELFLIDFDASDYQKNGIFINDDFPTYNAVYDSDLMSENDSIDIYNGTRDNIMFYVANDDESSFKKYSKMFFNAEGIKGLSVPEYYNWAIKPTGYNSLWIMYKSKIDGINVVIKKLMVQTDLDSSRHMFILFMFSLIFFFIFVYEHYKIVMAFLNRRKIQKIVYTDSVTGGHNKDYFLLKAQKMIKKRHRRNVIIYLRMEKYRNFITAYGIKEGENLMEDLNKCLDSMIRKRKELVAHLEKGDFVLLLNFVNEESLNIRMQTITNALNECRPKQHLYFSVGACRVVTKVDNLEEKISNAGVAISKQTNPTNEVFWFDEAMREEQVWERRVEDDMEKALENNEFQVYLQPKYSTKKEVLSAAEALVRWIHPECGFISPGRFIPIFEKNGFIIKLDDFMLTEIAKLQSKWLAAGKKLVPISVNVSRAHFTRVDLAEHICSIVDKYKVPHEYIELELTESAFFDDKQILLGTVKKLKDFGFKVSMDDFGAGYSSLNSLKELPLDIIKLDAQFFREIDDQKRAELIVSDTIKLAKKLGMQIVAEGIETREQVDFLANQHCDLIQGFYFAKPLPVKEFEERAFNS